MKVFQIVGLVLIGYTFCMNGWCETLHIKSADDLARMNHKNRSSVPCISTPCDLKQFLEVKDNFSDRSSVRYFTITEDIDMTDIKIQPALEKFTGELYVKPGIVISNLTINLPEQENVGFLSETEGAKISNLTFKNLKVTGAKNVGGVVGIARKTDIKNIRNISGKIISKSKDAGTAGGLVGKLCKESTICESCVGGELSLLNIQSPVFAGGLVGTNVNSNIENSFAGASVTVTSDSEQSAKSAIGGLVGLVGSGGKIKNSYASGNVKGSNKIGGLVGAKEDGAVVECSYWDKTICPIGSAGGVGRETKEMQGPKMPGYIYDGWSDDIWEFYKRGEGKYPDLQWYLPPPVLSFNSEKLYL